MDARQSGEGGDEKKHDVELVLEPAFQVEAAVLLEWLEREGVATASPDL